MIVIGIAGGSGSGKSTVVDKVLQEFAKNTISVLEVDSYYWDNGLLTEGERKNINFDHPASIEIELLISDLKKLMDGQAIQTPIYDYITGSRSKETVTVEPAEIIIIEGIFSLYYEELRDLLNIKIYVDTENDDRLTRIIGRDTIERGRTLETVLEHYNNTVKPMHLQFIGPTRYHADLIIPKGGGNKICIDIINSMLKYSLRSEA